MTSTAFEIIVGTYEEFLLGYNFNSNKSNLVQSFASHDHTSSVRTVAVSDFYAASGGADDRICIYDFKLRKESCMLTQHNSTVNCIEFTPNHSHVVSGSADGVLAVVRVGNWQLEKIWDKAHKGSSILDLSIHHTGKILLTLGSDSALRTWNLVKGRQAYVINLTTKCKDPRSLEKVLFNPEGDTFLLYGGKYTEIWSIETGGVVTAFEHETKVCSAVWVNEGFVLVGLEDGSAITINIQEGTRVKHECHESRVKCISKYENYIITASSSGEIKVWDDMEEVAKVDTGCRITCLDIISHNVKKEESESEDESETTQKIVKCKKKAVSKVLIEVEGSEDEDNTNQKVKKKKKNKKQNTEERFNEEKEMKKSNKNQEIEESFNEEGNRKSKKKKNKKQKLEYSIVEEEIERKQKKAKKSKLEDSKLDNKVVKKKRKLK